MNDFGPGSLIGPGDILGRAAARFGDKTALVSGGRRFSFTELDLLSSTVAAALAERGVAPGDRVSIYSQNRWEWVVAYHATLKAGAVVNPINVMLTPGEVAFVGNDCGTSVIFTADDKVPAILALAGEVPSLRTVVSFDGSGAGAEDFGTLLDSGAPLPSVPRPEPGGLCTIGYTSGTTGHPKGAMQSHQAVLLNCALTATMHVRTEHDVVLTALPAPHVYGNVVINGTFMAGGTVVLLERFDPKAALALIAEHRATLFEGVPTMYNLMLAEPGVAQADLSSLTRCTVGGQTMPVAVIEEWERRSGAPLLELWGMTEISGPGTTHSPFCPNVHGSIGVAFPGLEVRVADIEDYTRTMAPGEPGELLVRGPLVMMGYFNNPEATAEAIEPDGWLHTGDIATADETGHFFVVDRRKDMILTAGYNVYPAEIERVVSTHPAVAMVAVGGRPDDVKGEVARAYIVLRPGKSATEAEIIDHCRPHLAAYKLPRSVAFVDDLPKTSTGKVMRRELPKLD